MESGRKQEPVASRMLFRGMPGIGNNDIMVKEERDVAGGGELPVAGLFRHTSTAVP